MDDGMIVFIKAICDGCTRDRAGQKVLGKLLKLWLSFFTVTVEIPSGHEFSLEYWVNGLSEEWKGLKRRHQRDRREVLELFPNPGVADQVVFCSKNSIAGLNTESNSKLFIFNWFLNIHPTSVPSSASSSSSSWSSSKVPSLPTTTIFRWEKLKSSLKFLLWINMMSTF